MKNKLFILFLLLALTGCRSQTDWSEIFVSKGEYYFKKGRYEQAVDEYLKAQKLNPSSERIYRNLAEVYIEMRKYGAAVEAINSILIVNPNAGAEIYRLRGYVVAQDPARLEEAILVGYGPAIEKDPENGAYYQERGLLYQRLQRLAEAEQDFAAAKRLGYKT